MSKPEKIRVLVAEDDYLVGERIEELLAAIGYTVIGRAVAGVEAVEMTEATRPDVALMDIEMHGMSGLEAARLIQEGCPTPVVVLTAHETEDLVEQASAAGVGAYLVKPPDARELDRAIRIAIARFGDLMELRRLNAELEEALAQVKTLKGLLPICANCKDIRDDDGYWQDVAVYIRDRSEADFTHGLCPGCAKDLYPEFYEGD